jgi:16S rRNA (cytidine1402-2'-O)-methyltransferase
MLETPHRLQAALRDILAELGDRETTVCRELTKLYEEVFRGTISQAIDHFSAPRGEFTLVVAGSKDIEKPTLTPDIEARLAEMRRSGTGAREAVAKLAAETGLARKELYRAWLSIPQERR